jgi:hypothetical protein
MAQYDLILAQNTHASLTEFTERLANLTKGCIISADSARAPSVLTVGANTYVLSANSATTTGLEWIANPTTGISGTTSNTFTVDNDSAIGKFIIQAGLGAADFTFTITNTALTGSSKTATFQNATGVVAYLADVTYIGTTSVALNRASADLALTGITGLDASAASTIAMYASLTTGTITYASALTTGQVNIANGTGAMGAATSTAVNILSGAMTGTGTRTLNLGINAAAGTTTNINIGTTSTSTSTTNINLGAATTTTVTILGTFKVGVTTIAAGGSVTITLPTSAGTLARLTDVTYIGSTSVALNRSSADLALTGITSVDASAATAATLWSAVTTGTIAIGAALTTGQVNIANGATALGTTQTSTAVNILSGAMTVTTSGTRTVNIGNNGTANLTTNINLGTTATASSITNINIGAATTTTTTITGAVKVAGIISAVALKTDGSGTLSVASTTGSGSNVVLGTTPTFVTSVIGGASFDVFDTTSTTINAFGAATTLTLGYDGTGASTTNFITGAISTGLAKTINIGANGATGSTTTINIGTAGAGTAVCDVNLGSASGGTVTVNKNLTVTGDLTVNGTTTYLNSTTLQVDDINIELGTVGTPTDTTADGGGITLKGTTDKTIIWDNANDNWTFNQAVNISSGLTYKINNSAVLSATVVLGITGTDIMVKTIFDANTILYATSDNTPLALTVAEQSIVGRITAGAIASLTAAQVMGILWQTVPATKNTAGTAGWIAKDANYLYICTGASVWARCAIAQNW